MRRPLLVFLLLGACGRPTVAPPGPSAVPDVASLCTSHEEIAAPLAVTVPGYPVAVKTYGTEERIALQKEVTARSPDWTSIALDEHGFLDTAASRPQLRAGPYSTYGETGGTDADRALVERFVEQNPQIFGVDASDRVVADSRIGRHVQVRFWSSGTISMQAFFDNEDHERFWLGRPSFPLAARPVKEIFAPWVDVEIVTTPLPVGDPPCDPVSPDGHECARVEHPPEPSKIGKLEPARAQKILRADKSGLREVYWLQLNPEERPCTKVPRLVDAHTGEVFEWTSP